MAIIKLICHRDWGDIMSKGTYSLWNNTMTLDSNWLKYMDLEHSCDLFSEIQLESQPQINRLICFLNNFPLNGIKSISSKFNNKSPIYNSKSFIFPWIFRSNKMLIKLFAIVLEVKHGKMWQKCDPKQKHNRT